MSLNMAFSAPSTSFLGSTP